ncbi:hypothetical protein SeLEV6574_g06838 [Synchytrium endobioticum]|uniref:Uncharacterized protein n=1 Tax=Synchytrium endobioticum TaxID=286115 RepID=A0A507CM31_9FUNG|nr:hypothetical protein SeLEV6574_g06838 [Synchytrium endobioticum]
MSKCCYDWGTRTACHFVLFVSVFDAGDLKLNRLLGLHLFLLQAISNRDHIVSENEEAWRDFALVEDGIEQGLRLLRDEDKRLKWTKKAQFGSEIRSVYQQVAASVKRREFKV